MKIRNFEMFKFRILAIFVLFSSYLVLGVKAGYTSEEEDERSKSLYSAVTSILGSKDTSKHHHKHTYDSPPPCATGRCPTNIVPAYVSSGGPVAGAVPPPCGNPRGCPVAGAPVYGHGAAHTGGVYGQSGYTSGNGYGAYPPPPSQSLPVYPQPSVPSAPYISGVYATVPVSGPPQAPAGGYAYHQPAPPIQHGYQGHPGHYGYQGNRGYSVMDHSLSTKSEYTEVGEHTGPLQQANNGYGYGSGYGGYMGRYNRPGF